MQYAADVVGHLSELITPTPQRTYPAVNMAERESSASTSSLLLLVRIDFTSTI